MTPIPRTLTLRIPVKLVFWLDQAAFVILVLLALTFALEWRKPILSVGTRFVFTSVELIVMIVLALWVIYKIATLHHMPWPKNSLGLAVGTWLLISLVSAAVAPAEFRSPALLFCWRLVVGTLIGWAAYDLASRSERWITLAKALAIGGGIVALLGLMEALQTEPFLSLLSGFKVAPTRVGDVLRVSASLSYATIAAMILELTIPFQLVWLVKAKSHLLRIVLSMEVVLSLAVLALTISRAGVIVLLAVLIAMSILALQGHSNKAAAALAGAGVTLIVLVGLLLTSNPIIALRFNSETERLWYQAHYVAPVELTARPGSTRHIQVEIENHGLREWTNHGQSPFKLSYHLQRADGSFVTYDGARTPLPHSVKPGDTIAMEAELVTPLEVGDYLIQWEILQEGVTWFSWKANAPAETQLHIRGVPESTRILPQSSAPTDIRILAPTPERRELWLAALLMAADHPWLGVGPDNFRWMFGSYISLKQWDTNIHANNLYLELLADTGVFGLAAFLLMAGILLRKTYQGLVMHRSSKLWLWQLAAFGSLAAWFVHGGVDYFYEFTPTFVAFWIIAGLAARAETLTPVLEARDANWL